MSHTINNFEQSVCTKQIIMAGYSKTPLFKKLGIKEGFKACVIHPPDNYLELLQPLPDQIKWVTQRSKDLDFVHLFCRDTKTLESTIPKLISKLKRDGMIWVSWYKKSSKIPTDLNEDMIRHCILPIGLVDIKVCAVDEKWSGLKLVIRKELR